MRREGEEEGRGEKNREKGIKRKQTGGDEAEGKERKESKVED